MKKKFKLVFNFNSLILFIKILIVFNLNIISFIIQSFLN